MTKKETRLSAVKKLILSKLAGGKWISSASLLKATKQKYFDRRIRELRDELGFDIETSHVDGTPHYRLLSKKRNPPKIRTYLTITDKDTFLKEVEKKCALCGKQGEVGKSLVFDHRVPLLRGGAGSLENFQLLCRDCNNQKRTQCRKCEFDCHQCYLAFPEKYPQGIVLRPKNAETWKKIQADAAAKGVTIEEFILSLLDAQLK